MSDYSQTRSFNLGVAQEVSVEGALIYDDLAYAQSRIGKGKWFYRSYDNLMVRLPYSKRTIQTHIEKLVKAGWVEKKVMKVGSTPVNHFRILKNFDVAKVATSDVANSATSMDVANSATSTIKKTTITTKTGAHNSDDIGAAAPPTPTPPPSQKAADLLSRCIQIINPREKVTDDRIRVMNGRLKNYSEDEIFAAATEFSRSEWHKENNQMSIDNLIAPSKIGRWYAQALEASPGRDPRVYGLAA